MADDIQLDLGAGGDKLAARDDGTRKHQRVEGELEARTTLPTAVSDGNLVTAMADDFGRQVVAPHSPRDLVTKNRIALTTTIETSLIASGGTGVFRDLVQLVLSNESTAEVRVDIRDDTAGTIVYSFDLAADGGGFSPPFAVPCPQAVANKPWTAQLSAAVSTVYITAMAVDNK